MSNKLLFVNPNLNLNEKIAIVGSSKSLNGFNFISKSTKIKNGDSPL